MENGRRSRRYRLRSVKNETADVAAFIIVLMLLALVAAVIYSGVGTSLPFG